MENNLSEKISLLVSSLVEEINNSNKDYLIEKISAFEKTDRVKTSIQTCNFRINKAILKSKEEIEQFLLFKKQNREIPAHIVTEIKKILDDYLQ